MSKPMQNPLPVLAGNSASRKPMDLGKGREGFREMFLDFMQPGSENVMANNSCPRDTGQESRENQIPALLVSNAGQQLRALIHRLELSEKELQQDDGSSENTGSNDFPPVGLAVGQSCFPEEAVAAPDCSLGEPVREGIIPGLPDGKEKAESNKSPTSRAASLHTAKDTLFPAELAGTGSQDQARQDMLSSVLMPKKQDVGEVPFNVRGLSEPEPALSADHDFPVRSSAAELFREQATAGPEKADNELDFSQPVSEDDSQSVQKPAVDNASLFSFLEPEQGIPTSDQVLPERIAVEELPAGISRLITKRIALAEGKEGRGGSKGMVIQLEPRELGKLLVKLTTEEGIVSVRIVAENPDAKGLLENSLSSLRQSLAEQGIKHGNIEVDLGGYYQQDHHQQQGWWQNSRAYGSYSLEEEGFLAESSLETETWEHRAHLSGAIDYRV